MLQVLLLFANISDSSNAHSQVSRFSNRPVQAVAAQQEGPLSAQDALQRRKAYLAGTRGGAASSSNQQPPRPASRFEPTASNNPASAGRRPALTGSSAVADPRNRAAIDAFMQQYLKLADHFTIPSGALQVLRIATVFSLREAPVLHYIWKSNETLYIFPVWHSIEKNLNDPSRYHSPAAQDEKRILRQALPISRITSYYLETDRLALSYWRQDGKIATTFFDAKALDALRRLIPMKEENFIRRQKYLGSSKNIGDMRQALRQLERQYSEGEISPDEYERAKRYIALCL